MGTVGDPDLGPADAPPPPPDDICSKEGLTRRPYRSDGTGLGFGDVAGNFSVRELDGSTWTFAEAFTGCESYVFITYFPPDLDAPIGGGRRVTGGQLFSSDLNQLVAETPLNSHFFFLSDEDSSDTRQLRMELVENRLNEVIERQPEADREAHRHRFHLVVDRASEAEGSLGAFFSDYLSWRHTQESFVDLGERGIAPSPPPFFVGIDRFQRWDAGGSPSEFVGGPAHVRMASYLPLFYDHKSDVADRAESPATEVALVDEAVTERILTRTVELPDEGEMADFDSLSFDIAVNCRERNVFACSEWDRIARISLCETESCEGGRQELVRWITPYWRRGDRRWIMDASPLLGLVTEGGTQTFQVVMGPSWERKTVRDLRVALRLSNEGKGERAVGAVRTATGGAFDETYNDREPVPFEVPPDATRVELVSILSGHGQADGTNCSEWCDHRHRFTVNGQSVPTIRHGGDPIGSIGPGCGAAAAQGASPGQFGNWAPQRAYWCPGLPVAPIRQDITALSTIGGSNAFDYEATLGRSGDSGGGNISLNTYVVWYR